jgi:hypothetical protein
MIDKGQARFQPIQFCWRSEDKRSLHNRSGAELALSSMIDYEAGGGDNGKNKRSSKLMDIMCDHGPQPFSSNDILRG